MSVWNQLAKSGAKALAKKAHVSTPEEPWSVKDALRDLKSDSGLSRQYIERIIHGVKHSQGVKEVMRYLKSDAAANLSPWQKAELWIVCLDRLRFLDIT